ncbi:MAG: DUF1971 domain-containing protein [Pseudomonadota bacterium]
MKSLPENVTAYKRTPSFTTDTVPKGLLRAHKTKAGTWGKINVERGKLLYRILEPEIEEVLLSDQRYGVVEPTVLHEVAPQGEVEFYVEFYK